MNENLERGRKLLAELDPEGSTVAARAALNELASGFAELTVELAFGAVRGRDGLDQRSRELATVAALCVLGRERQLAVHLGYALNLGWRRRELAEAIVQLAPYGGWPVAVNGLTTLRSVLGERVSGRVSLGGGTVVTVISDGSAQLPAATFALGLEGAERRAAERELGAPLEEPIDVPLNPVVIEHGGKLILIDPGSGPADAVGSHGLVPRTAGHFLQRFGAAGFRTEDVDLVVLTHLHHDHAGALLAEPFPRAEIVLARTELEHWLGAGDLGAAALPAEVRGVVAAAATDVAIRIRDRARLVEDGEEIVEGLRAIAVPGHTPGQLAVSLEAGEGAVLFAADTVCHAALSVSNPASGHMADYDPAQGRASRSRILKLAIEGGFTLHAFHLPTPGLGLVEVSDDRMGWVPARTG